MNNNFRLLLIVSFLAMSFASHAQVITIAEARTKALGTNVKIRGVITNGGELGTSRFIQDGTAGIGIYSANNASLERGDSIEVSGDLGHFNNLLQLSSNVVFTTIQKGVSLPTPKEFTYPFTAAFAKKYEGQLIKLNGVTSIKSLSGSNCGNAPTTFSGNTNYCLNSTASTPMRVSTPTAGSGDLVNTNVPTGNLSVIGIMSLFNKGTAPGGTTTDPKYYDTTITTGFQCLVRLYEDLVLPPLPNILTDPYAISIGKDSIVVKYITLNDASTKLSYGTSLSLGSTIGDSTSVKEHIVVLRNLTPGTIYYLQAFSTNSNGTSVSRITLVTTQSESTGEIRVYFNQTVDNSVATFKNAIQLDKTMDDTLIQYINMAKSTIDLAIYNINPNGVSNYVAALNNAYNRGVRVRVVGDGSTNSIGLTNLNANIGVIQRPVSSSNIMHNKFMVIDVNSSNPNDVWVWGGSTNLTRAQLESDRNNMIFIQDQSLAKAYTIEFEEMFGSSDSMPNSNKAKFGAAKTDNTPHEFNIGGRWVEMYFSPSDRVTSKIINTVNTGNKDTYFCILSFTRSDISAALRNRAYTGVYGAGIVEDTAGSYTAVNVFNTLVANNVYNTRMRIDGSSPQLHHKYLIVDANSDASDPVLLTGSHNWSSNAETDNDENTLVIHDDTIANLYYQEFVSRYNESGTADLKGFANFKASHYTPVKYENVTFKNLTTMKNVSSYLWDFGDGQTSAQKNPSHFYTNGGTYTVKLTATDGNITDIEQQTIKVIDQNSISDIYSDNLYNIYPNPSNQFIQVQSRKEIQSVIIYNILGEIIFQENYNGLNFVNLPIQNLASGLYILSVNNQTKKFVKE